MSGNGWYRESMLLSVSVSFADGQSKRVWLGSLDPEAVHRYAGVSLIACNSFQSFSVDIPWVKVPVGPNGQWVTMPNLEHSMCSGSIRFERKLKGRPVGSRLRQTLCQIVGEQARGVFACRTL